MMSPTRAVCIEPSPSTTRTPPISTAYSPTVIGELTRTAGLFPEFAIASRSEYSASGPRISAIRTGASGTSYWRIT